ncbi:MAG TPA: DEAD/DEAH box helicase [Armatimonadota bacterium]|jgi:superfamily II DNA/RNA helicase
MDVFGLREQVVDEYRGYVESFLRIWDGRIGQVVTDALDGGALWPEAILQLNPAYEPGPSLRELTKQGRLCPQSERFFMRNDGSPLQLYRHQAEALEIAQRREPYVVTTGTGSGKSLTYLLPIYDHIAQTNPKEARTRALIVYPMNALINSQYESLQRYAQGYPDSPVRFGRYTGQEKDEDRKRIQDSPPHILLTNYVMLEYMLLRAAERVFTSKATANLEFLVLDELHTYRGRQGADVAMLVRRLRERCGNPKLQCIGTSATLASEGTRDQRRATVAEVAGKVFGVTVPPANVVDETLRRTVRVPVPTTGAELRAAVELPLPPATVQGLSTSPLAAWVEEAFGLRTEDGRLVRQTPITFRQGVTQLADGSGLPVGICEERLKGILGAGNSVVTPEGDPLFAFRLHQFLATGGSVYATLESPDQRSISLEGRYYAPDGERVLYPLVFCRECGQEYYQVSWRQASGGGVAPQLAGLDDEEDSDSRALSGYLLLDEEGLWGPERQPDLPDYWWDFKPKVPRIRKEYQPHLPVQLWLSPKGEPGDDGEGVKTWFQPSPFLLCLRCGAAFDRTQKSDYRKLARLSQAGRSTSTTVVSGAAIGGMRQAEVEREACKILSFTDNRQDASLQAGHFQDFLQVALLRSAIYRALGERREADHAELPGAVFKALGLSQEAYAKQVAEYGPGKVRNEKALKELLEYLLYEDLRRGWRVAQPNLEECGLLRITYPGLDEMARVGNLWERDPVLHGAGPTLRYTIIHAFLEHLRRELAINAQVLEPDRQDELKHRVIQTLREPWSLGKDAQLRSSSIFLLPPMGAADSRERSLSDRSRLGRFLRSRATWGIEHDLDGDQYLGLIDTLVSALRGHFLSVAASPATGSMGVQLLADSLYWTLGDGTPPSPDPVRSRWMLSLRQQGVGRRANKYFAHLYKQAASALNGIRGEAHTAQVKRVAREEREASFREGNLQALFCSPTMELGVDIRDLNVVHMRNIPPTPANYAQRSGRAGRGGQPALVIALCSEGSPHDQYFFRRPYRMVSGAVAPARIDLTNEDLLSAHIHSLWLAATGVSLGRSVSLVLALEEEDLPLSDDIASRLALSAQKRTQLLIECQNVLDSCGSELLDAPWFHGRWLDGVIDGAGLAFNSAFARWRELYREALVQRDEAQKAKNKPVPDSAARKERERAMRRESEAIHQIDLLLNQGDDWAESDFYPYRYLSSEGFLPGYSFPRLPVRALVTDGDDVHAIDRPRFLALSEFGPHNVIYHEGRKYRMLRTVLPPGGIESRLAEARFCEECGYLHEGDGVGVDTCDNCGSPLGTENSLHAKRLFEMSTVRGSVVERITCDEEERLREGFRITTHFRCSPGQDGLPLAERAHVSLSGGLPLMEVLHAPQATLWRVNHGWRRSELPGFTLDPTTGRWANRPDETPNPDGSNQSLAGVRPFVRDTRNLLLLTPAVTDAFAPGLLVSDRFLAALGYALQRGIQAVFQVEQNEVAVERIGRGPNQRLLLWEAAEGGTGVWPRLLEEPDALAQVAREALRICHFDPDSGADERADDCSRACYDCLLSYSNQPDHAKLDRHLIQDYLRGLSQSRLLRDAQGRDYQQHYQWLLERKDPESSLEGALLDLLYNTRRRLPDKAQFRPEEGVYAEADFFYEGQGGSLGVCVFCDGSPHDEPSRAQKDRQSRDELGDRGYQVVVIRFDEPLVDQVERRPDVFGAGV